MEDKGQTQGLEGTLFHLLEHGGRGGDPMILLSLVNLMGLINLIGHRMGVDMGSLVTGVSGEKESGKGFPSRPVPREIPPPLAGLLGSLLGAPGATGGTAGPPPVGSPPGPEGKKG
ncbi:hypothetical protein GFC01_13340 [Desulfofundulus thermobenzoicus]|uniref:Uncharacterized protein n=1 Tax=Desulfofundulus thermobenzoicus TaxID=29376 RepID=A0A6N7IT20_9FIRM|nr:hypothetical protein [Desulfofundulus thermobenzoicus]MQL53224.1 hypothetical protein [Desulfofundulus thermobenzoicus]HHW43820.1 hypothetical protein [Desulfotomaculum sp.]